jgi:Nucleotidyl transferase AbiEii toxin, Type IV TA system
MPLTDFQKGVARLIAANRKPESHIAGGAVINRGEAALRISNDIDIFHDIVKDGQKAIEIVTACAEADERLLREAGYSVEWITREEGFFRAVVSRGDKQVRLDWATESAFRFFPVQQDEDFGYCLHLADLATNKVLALVGRSEIRDFLDILQLDHGYLSLGALIWAACGKDEGFTPSTILELMNRHSRYQENDLKAENLAREVNLKALKEQWIAARQRAEVLVALLPAHELGCLYLENGRTPVTPDPSAPEFPKLVRHRGSVLGAWPSITTSRARGTGGLEMSGSAAAQP